MQKSRESALADILFPSVTDEELKESILDIPPEQRRLHTDTYDFSISTILNHLEDNHIFIPEFQRRYVWTQTQASRLIESLIIQCPIPVIYLSQEKDERLAVIDGNQRLRSISNYVNNEFALKGLTSYPELEDMHFSGLDTRFQRHILNRTLRCITITKDTHPQVKFDVFERLNTGAVRLTAQELRHGIYHGSFVQLVEKLNKVRDWKDLLPANVEKRMKGEELIVRFFAMHYDLKSYKKPLSNFLNEFTEKNRDISDQKAEELETVFRRTVKGVKQIYGNLAFKVFDANLRPTNNFNAALFDAEMLSISKLSEKDLQLTDKKIDSFFKKLSILFQSEEFSKSITRATSDENRLSYRVNEVRSALSENLL